MTNVRLRYLSICCEKLSFCAVVTRDDGNPGGCSASFNHTTSREKQFLFREKITSANWSMRLRDAPPPMPWREGKKYDNRDLISAGREVWWAECSNSEMMKRFWVNVSCGACFSPPARPASAACRPPASPEPEEAHLSSGVSVQSEAETQNYH